MNKLNLPVQVISMCNTDGAIRPIRFRFEDEEHQLITADITEVRTVNEIHYAGVDVISCICKTAKDGKEKLVDLRYHIKTHKWVLFEVIY